MRATQTPKCSLRFLDLLQEIPFLIYKVLFNQGAYFGTP